MPATELSTDKKKSELFLSYAWGKEKVNQKRVLFFKNYLEKTHSFRSWMDVDHVAVGKQLFTEIEKGIRESTAVVIILTKEYPISVNCRKEIALADALGKPLIPLMFETNLEWPPEGLGMFLSGSVYLQFHQNAGKDKFWSDGAENQLIEQFRNFGVEASMNLKLTKQQSVARTIASSKKADIFEIEDDEKISHLKSSNWDYRGEVKNGVPDGKGTKKWQNGTVHYGEWKDGQSHGSGIRQWGANGGQFSGDWSEGEWVYGTYSWPDESRYVGEFKEFKRHGDGIFKYGNGDRYVGKWEGDLKTGRGTYVYANGMIFEGSWEKNAKLGHGKMSYENGDLYDGLWSANKKNGLGEYKYNSGNIYKGTWKNDKKNGQGKFEYHFGDIYEGAWVENKRHGWGVYRYAQGDVYVGNYIEDNRTGTGTYWYGAEGARKGDCYAGEWTNGKKVGKGLYVWANGEYFDGEWKDNERQGVVKKLGKDEARKLIPVKPKIALEWDGLATFKKMKEIKVGKCDACGRDDSHDFLLNETAVSPESQTAVEPVAVKTVNVKTADVEKVEKGMQTSTFMMDFGYQVNQHHIENKVGKKSEACVLQ